MLRAQQNIKKQRCPCGESYYTIKELYDGCGKFDEYWEMKCDCCKKNYQLSSALMETETGLRERHLWAPAKMYAKLSAEQERLHKAQSQALALAHELFLEKWMLYCCQGRSKKDVWSRMTNRGKNEPAFGLFDRLVDCQNMVDYLRNYFNYQNMDYVLEVLEVREPQLDVLKKQVKEQQRKVDKINVMLRPESAQRYAVIGRPVSKEAGSLSDKRL